MSVMLADFFPTPMPVTLTVKRTSMDPPPAPKKPRNPLRDSTTIFEPSQRMKKLVLNWQPECTVEETDIDDLLTETRRRCVLDIVENSRGETILLYDDGSYEMAKNMQ